MKFLHIGGIAIIFVVIAVSIAGCTSSSPATPEAPVIGGAPSGGSAVTSVGSAAPSGGSAAPAELVGGNQLFGGLTYDWAEYRMSGGTGAGQMTIYYNYNHKTGKCTMRFEGAITVEGMPSEMDCSESGASSGGQSAGNPNDVGSDVTFVKIGTESVTVPAGTFDADRYTATMEGTTTTYWIANGKPLLRMESGNTENKVVMELNGWG